MEWQANHIIEGDPSELPSITAFGFINDSFLVVAYQYNDVRFYPIRVWDLENQTSRVMEQHSEQIEPVRLLYCTETVLVTIGDNYICIWDPDLKRIEHFNNLVHPYLKSVAVAFKNTHPIIVYQEYDILVVEYNNDSYIIKVEVQCVALSDNGKYLVYINQENILTVFDTDVKEMIQEIQLDEELLICQCLFKPNSLEIAIGSSSDVTFVTFFPSEDTHHSFSKRHIQEEQKTSTTQLSFTMCLTQETLVLYRDDNKNDHKMQLWEGHRYEGLTEISCPYLLQPVVCGLRSSLNHFAVMGTFYIYFFAHSYNMVVLTWRPNPNEMIDILSFNSSPFQSPFHSTSSSSDTQTIHPSIVYHDKDILPTTIEKYQWKKIKEPIPVMDWISGEETPLLEHMKSEEDSFYFWIPNMLCLAFTKDKMEELKKDFSNIKYECKKVDTTLVPRLENIKKKNPFLALRSLGFFGGLLPLNEIKSAYKSKHRLFHLSKTEKRCLTITSLQMLTSNPQAVSADHCQIGKDDFVYTLKYIPDHYLIRNVTKSKKKRTKPKSVTKTKRETKKSIK